MSERRSTRQTSRIGKFGTGNAEVDRCIARQKVLRQELLKDLQEKYKGEDSIDENNNYHVQKMASINCYRETSEFPSSVKTTMCSVDLTRDVLFIPFQGSLIPVHASTIKNAQYYEDTSDPNTVKRFLRLTFQVPGSNTNSDMMLPDLTEPQSFFFRELSIRSDKPGHLQEVARQITEIHKRMKSQDAQVPVAPIQQIQLNKNQNKIILRSTMVRYTGAPTRRPIGSLEAHMNGIRYTSSGTRDNIDINYSNIEHCIFQPCKNDMLTILHFHLKNPIMISNKRQKDVQFYKEIGSLVDDLDSRRQRARDPDEVAEEAKEMRMKQLTNSEFKKFVEGMQELAGKYDMRIELPLRKLSFRGVPRNENVELIPTTRCICHLNSWPPFIVSLKDVQIVALERVVLGLRNFDMVIIFKDYSKKHSPINACDMSSIHIIKKWLTESDIVWYESKVPLYWPKILKTLKSDPNGFYAQGGFGAFMADGDDDKDSYAEESSEDQDDEVFKGGSASDYSDDDSDTSLASGSSSSSSRDSEGGEGSKKPKKDKSRKDGDEYSSGSYSSYEASEESEPGLDWDDHEKAARQEERNKKGPHPSNGQDRKRPRL